MSEAVGPTPAADAERHAQALLLPGVGRRLADWIAWAMMAQAGLVLLAWQLRLPALIQIRPEYAPMQFNTALGLFLCGLTLRMRPGGGSRWTLIPAILALGAGATLAQDLLSVDLAAIDELFVPAYIEVQTASPGANGAHDGREPSALRPRGSGVAGGGRPPPPPASGRWSRVSASPLSWGTVWARRRPTAWVPGRAWPSTPPRASSRWASV